MKIYRSSLVQLFRSWMLIILFLPFMAFAESVDDAAIETFYKDPTYSHFIKSIEKFSVIEFNPDPQIEQKDNHLCNLNFQ
ncbi:MAG: hypothetical protein ACHQJ6_08055 [Candidatus Berkiellales bacterium]